MHLKWELWVVYICLLSIGFLSWVSLALNGVHTAIGVRENICCVVPVRGTGEMHLFSLSKTDNSFFSELLKRGLWQRSSQLYVEYPSDCSRAIMNILRTFLWEIGGTERKRRGDCREKGERRKLSCNRVTMRHWLSCNVTLSTNMHKMPICIILICVHSFCNLI